MLTTIRKRKEQSCSSSTFTS